MPDRRQMRVQRIDDQGDRLVLYGKGDERYHVIASAKDVVQPGDLIEYEPYGFNFGWFRQVVTGGTINHKDGDPRNNALDNLEIRPARREE